MTFKSSLLKDILGRKLWVFDQTSVTIVCSTSSINTFLSCIYLPKRLFLLDTHSKDIYVIGLVFLVFIIYFSVADDFQDCICQVCCFFFPHHFHCRHQGRVVLTKVSEEVFLESHFNGLFWDPEIFIFVDQVEDFVKGNLVAASIINDSLQFKSLTLQVSEKM